MKMWKTLGKNFEKCRNMIYSDGGFFPRLFESVHIYIYICVCIYIKYTYVYIYILYIYIYIYIAYMIITVMIFFNALSHLDRSLAEIPLIMLRFAIESPTSPCTPAPLPRFLGPARRRMVPIPSSKLKMFTNCLAIAWLWLLLWVSNIALLLLRMHH